MRLFAAIHIEASEEFKKTLRFLSQNLKEDKIKWVDPNNLHLTLKFFGNTPAKKITAINKVLFKVASETAELDLQLAQLGQFGSQYSPKVLWMGLQEPQTIIDLGERILNDLEEIGFMRDRQNFVPHFTLGRINQIKSKTFYQKVIARVKDKSFEAQHISQIRLYESVLTPDGPVYNLVQAYPLGTAIGKKSLGKPILK